ncbi:MAG: hypothetical protein NVS3B19_11290 [Ginsengibacter sp.]
MKVVIIGGGIGGMTLGILLERQKIDVVVNERLSDTPERGHAFLMHKEGLAILKDLNVDHKTNPLGKIVETFSLRRPGGVEIKHINLKSWKCIKRSDLVLFLNSIFPESKLKRGRNFSHFLKKEGKVVAAVFDNGQIEYGDVFVGADGSNSKVRDLIFGEINFSEVRVKEVVGVLKNEELVQKAGKTFIKYQHHLKGLAFGFIATSNVELVWFMQYDSMANDVSDTTPEGLRIFCEEMLHDFPKIVKDIISNNDFSRSYIWNTRDADLFDSFHKDNVVLIGDAAHLSLPFTSAGTTNAIVDAKAVAEVLLSGTNMGIGFREFYLKRSKEIKQHIELGRELKEVFLHPQKFIDDQIPVPLIAQKEYIVEEEHDKIIDILYFTDPICSTCWIIQPLLLKLKLEYGKYFNLRYCMGGMLPSWEEYTKGKISNPEDAAKHWEEVSVSHEMPLDGDVWIEDPLLSSYPPSIAFKAAQMQDNHLSLLFLRRIKEMVFVEKKNIIKWENLESAAFECGLDTARLLRDYHGKAKELFSEDLKLGKQLGIITFPTFIFKNKTGDTVTIKGLQRYDRFTNIIQRLAPSAMKENINTDPENLFKHYPTLAEKEFAFLSELNKEEAK